MNNETGLAAKLFDHATNFPPFCKNGSASDGGGGGRPAEIFPRIHTLPPGRKIGKFIKVFTRGRGGMQI